MKTQSRNYHRLIRHRRIRQTLAGTAAIPRLNVFKSNRFIYAQIIDDAAGKTLVNASSQNMAQFNNKASVEAARAVGEAIAAAAQQAKITKVVFDRGGYLYHGKVKALAEAARSKGLQF